MVTNNHLYIIIIIIILIPFHVFLLNRIRFSVAGGLRMSPVYTRLRSRGCSGWGADSHGPLPPQPSELPAAPSQYPAGNVPHHAKQVQYHVSVDLHSTKGRAAGQLALIEIFKWRRRNAVTTRRRAKQAANISLPTEAAIEKENMLTPGGDCREMALTQEGYFWSVSPKDKKWENVMKKYMALYRWNQILKHARTI